MTARGASGRVLDVSAFGGMLVATDVHYVSDTEARAAALCFGQWSSESPSAQHVRPATGFGPYQPGALYLRELPCIEPLLREVMAAHPVELLIVDGFVDTPYGPGLGRHLRRAFPELAVVGVAKNPFPGAPAIEVHRGGARPLYVSACGIDLQAAAEGVQQMHGPHRLPTLLVRVDHLARGLVTVP